LRQRGACSGYVNPTDWDQIWQYGSDEATLKREGTPWLLDGVAPQCPIKGLPKEKRAFIPETEPQGFVESHLIKNYGWIFKRTEKEKGYVSPRK